jgi:hypothetical protein
MQQLVLQVTLHIWVQVAKKTAISMNIMIWLRMIVLLATLNVKPVQELIQTYDLSNNFNVI